MARRLQPPLAGDKSATFMQFPNRTIGTTGNFSDCFSKSPYSVGQNSTTPPKFEALLRLCQSPYFFPFSIQICSELGAGLIGQNLILIIFNNF